MDLIDLITAVGACAVAVAALLHPLPRPDEE
jgi:hypothetical protein